jgi:hypothetical protein
LFSQILESFLSHSVWCLEIVLLVHYSAHVSARISNPATHLICLCWVYWCTFYSNANSHVPRTFPNMITKTIHSLVL